MSPLRLVYLGLAVVGAILPLSHFIPWLQANGWSFSAMAAAWNVNAATTGLVWDLTISAIAFTIWVIADSRNRRDRLGLVAIPAIFLVGLSFGVPLYLFMRGRRAA